ncbi:PAS domain S-box-containing protein/diguanylate cyclase (GGDEF) domain-containing protein [Rhodobacter capsulatus]|uniref:PAS domain S-box-containing protein/diguanylate cyclase (GGDEF) domain-containing protein n=2 Tax=Rhodobacter capsulatus TaxID=1061 RepID=A0A1G7IFJ8_RHOCA|nr:PAS domain S-box-containing protein/diguanylate cyclase (GGDEF) domain-containing protein [Rhodobacter capsulatus]
MRPSAGMIDADLAGGFGHDLVTLTELQFRQVAAALTAAGLDDTVLLVFNRLRLGVVEQAAALGQLIEEGARQQADLEAVHKLLRDAPVPILSIDATLGLHYSNEAARRFLGESFEQNGGAALRRALTRPQIGRLSAALAQPCEPTGPGRDLTLVFSPAPGQPRTAQATLLRARKPQAGTAGLWWLMLLPEAGTGPALAQAGADLRRLLLDTFPDPVSVTDADGRISLANRAFLRANGRSEAEVIGQLPQDFLPLIEALHGAQLDARVRKTQSGITLEQTRQRPADGRVTPSGAETTGGWERLRTEKTPLFDDFGAVVGVVTRSHDVTEEVRARELAEMVFDQSSEAIVLTDPDLRILRANVAFEQVAGFGQARLVGRLLEGLWGAMAAPGPGALPEAAGPQEAWLAELQARGIWRGEAVLRSSEGKSVICWSRITRLADASGRVLGHVAMFSDLTPLRQAQADNLRLANYDLLTGLPNRNLLGERIDGWIELAARSGRGFAVLFIDLDQFKAVNDTLGHETGDMLLSAVAQRLRIGAGADHFIARIGGDEFVLLLGDTGAEAAQRQALALLEALAVPIDLPGLHQYRPAATVGIACFGAHGESRDALLRNADLAMYAGKMSRRTVMLYEPQMGVEAARELDLRNALAGAVERGEMVLQFQPLFALADRGLRGCEALIRWNRPGRGLIPPGDFLPVAQRAGLMPALDRWVFAEATRTLCRWRKSGLVGADWLMSINQTAADLAAPDWAEALTGCAGCACACSGLQIELTEDQLADRVPGAVEALGRLRARGLRLAIDDFGTGYSCLAYLARLPVSMLKIDAHFVRGIEADRNARLIVEAITGLARRFGYATLAEGIETEAEAATLAAMGCDMGQGFLLSPPLARAAFEARFLRPAA